VAAYKHLGAKVAAAQAGLKPYWGKPTVRNFRGGGGNDVHGLVTICHDARKGGYTGSHWPKHVRASTPLDSQPIRPRVLPVKDWPQELTETCVVITDAAKW